MVRPLSDQEKKELLQGPADLRAKQASDWEFIVQSIGTIVDPRLRALSETFVNKWGDRFRRAAAARKYHHARRGGLVEHTAQMMRLARAIAPLYSQLNLDLLIAGILFHDSGKLWENQFSETGFVMSYDELGELVGHISIGLEIVNSLWQKLAAENADVWKTYRPLSEDVRIHLLHLIGSHHGDKQLGSPVDPKTPEAMALHYIDNLDARLEMFAAGYTTAKPLAARIFDRVRPLPGNLVKSLEKFQRSSESAPVRGRTSVTRYEHTQIGHVIIWSLLAIILIASGFAGLSHREIPLVVSIILLASLVLFYKLRITIDGGLSVPLLVLA